MKASGGSENTEVVSTNGLQNTKGKGLACLYGPCPPGVCVVSGQPHSGDNELDHTLKKLVGIK